ncbi:MAG: NBR1-Ig-like domain-containing protein [Anaerolineales bacterium]
MFHRIAPVLLFLSLTLAACRAQKPAPVDQTAVIATAVNAGATSSPQAEITQTSPSATPTPLPPAASSPTVTVPEASPTSTPTQAPQQPTAPTTSATANPTSQPSTEVTPSAPAAGDSTSSSQCQEKAAFYGDVTIPDDTFFNQGEQFTKTWRFRNEGTCTWTPDYNVVFYSGEIMNAALSNPFLTTVPPGEQVEISIDMQAPTRGGPFQSVWGFEDPNGVRFGTGSAGSDLFWVKIDVRFLDQNDQPQPDPGSLPPPPTPTGCSAQEDSSVEAQVLALINQMRSANGLNPLSQNGALSAAALVHSTDMACNNFVAHSGSDGSNWADRISAQGYQYATYPLENIYVGDPQFGGNAQGAVTWWMNSQVHRDNILNNQVTETGVGYVYDPNSEYGGYYTMVFAQP